MWPQQSPLSAIFLKRNHSFLVIYFALILHCKLPSVKADGASEYEKKITLSCLQCIMLTLVSLCTCWGVGGKIWVLNASSFLESRDSSPRIGAKYKEYFNVIFDCNKFGSSSVVSQNPKTRR